MNWQKKYGMLRLKHLQYNDVTIANVLIYLF